MTPRTRTLIATSLLLGFVAAELSAQRPRRFRRPTPRPAPAAEPEAKEEAKKDENKEKAYLAIVGADVYVGTGQLLRRATVLIADDKIENVGPGIEIPEGAKRIDASGKVVSPGFVAVRMDRGVGSSAIGDQAADSVNPFDTNIKMALAAGLTSYLRTSGGGTGSVSGNSTVFKLAYGSLKGMVLENGTVLKTSVPLSAKQMDSLRKAVEAAKKYRKDKQAYEKKMAAGDKKAKAPKAPRGAVELLKAMDGEARVWVTCRGNFDNDRIREALQISRLLGVGVVLEDPTTAWSVADEIAATGSMVVFSPRDMQDPDPARPETTGSNMAMGRILDEVGVPVAVHPPRTRYGGSNLGLNGLLGQDLHTPHIDAAYLVRGGLDTRKALKALTLDAAKMLGVDKRIGSLEPGKDADILILDGDPLHYKTFVDTAIVNGKVVYEKAKEPFYNHLKR